MLLTRRGQDLRRMYWVPMESADWLTACVPVQLDHQVLETFEIFDFDTDEGFEADRDIACGRTRTFDSIEGLIDDLKEPA